MSDKPRRIKPEEKDTIIKWFMLHMTHEQRIQVIGQFPVIYALLYPTTPPDEILYRVRLEIDKARGQVDPIAHRLNL